MGVVQSDVLDHGEGADIQKSYEELMNDSEKQCDMIRSVSSLWLPWGKWIFGGPWGDVRRPARRPLPSKMKNNEGLNYSVNWVGEKGKLLGWLAVRSEGKGALRNNSWAAFWVGLGGAHLKGRKMMSPFLEAVVCSSWGPLMTSMDLRTGVWAGYGVESHRCNHGWEIDRPMSET